MILNLSTEAETLQEMVILSFLQHAVNHKHRQLLVGFYL